VEDDDDDDDDWEEEGQEDYDDVNHLPAEKTDSKLAKDPNGTSIVFLVILFPIHESTVAARESHKVQKELLNQRRAAKPHSSLLVEAKRAWALARQKDIASAERRKHVAALMSVIKGNVSDIVLKHDASRIVQTVVKYGTPEERNQIALELKGKFKQLAESRYSKVGHGQNLVL
jgi:pumilio family protein 6